MEPSETTPAEIYDIDVLSWDGQPVSMGRFRGRVLLVVNVASQCGFTPQYAGLEQLQRKYHERGFDVLGFPCNQFGRQEPGSNSEVQEFCKDGYDITFPVFAKIDVNGPAAHPLFVLLKTKQPGVLGSSGIKWNFTKFLVDRAGRVVARFASTTTPAAIESQIVRQLG